MKSTSKGGYDTGQGSIYEGLLGHMKKIYPELIIYTEDAGGICFVEDPEKWGPLAPGYYFDLTWEQVQAIKDAFKDSEEFPDFSESLSLRLLWQLGRIGPTLSESKLKCPFCEGRERFWTGEPQEMVKHITEQHIEQVNR